MSTQDPVAAKQRRIEARRGSVGSLIGIVIALILVALGGALVTRALFGFAEFEISAETDEPPLAIFGMAVGLPLTLIGFFVYFGATRRFTGKLMSSPGVGPGTVLFLGLAAGAWWGALSLREPGALWLVPVGLSVVAVLFLLLGVVARLRRRGRRDALAQVVVSGRIARGEITDIPVIDPSSGGLIGVATVKFTDLAGVDRWVQKTGQWSSRDLPKTGDAAAVLYDPQRPADTSRMWIAPVGSMSAADFERWHS